MAKPKNKKNRRRQWLKRLTLSVVVIIVYAGLLAGGIYLVVFNWGRHQSGLLVPGETISNPGFSRSLDLKVAAKNTYPSGPISVVRDLGSSGGISKKTFSFKVEADGLTEYGLMLLPTAKAPAAGFPVLVLCHGYESPSEYSTQESEVPDMEFFASHGFAVIKPDYRGQGLSMNQGHADSAYYSMSYNTDVMSLLTAVKKTSYLDKKNINIWGLSLGAYIGLRAAILSPEIKNLILLSGPVDSLKKMYLTYIPPSDTNNLDALKSRNDVFAKYGNPVENNAFWNAASPINFVSKLKAYVQIDVGAMDQVVPPEFSADLNDALTKAKIRHDYYVYPDGNHGLSPQRSLVWSRALQALSAPALTPPA